MRLSQANAAVTSVSAATRVHSDPTDGSEWTAPFSGVLVEFPPLHPGPTPLKFTEVAANVSAALLENLLEHPMTEPQPRHVSVLMMKCCIWLDPQPGQIGSTARSAAADMPRS